MRSGTETEELNWHGVVAFSPVHRDTVTDLSAVWKCFHSMSAAPTGDHCLHCDISRQIDLPFPRGT